MRPFDLSCTTDADCRLVDTSPCNRCTCADTPISARAEQAFAEASAKIRCEGVQIYPCVDCLAVAPYCHEGKCTAISTEPIPEGGECQHDRDCVVFCVDPKGCCPPASCEDTISRKAAAELSAKYKARCPAEAMAECPPVAPPEYLRPRCRRGTCYGEFLER